LRRTARSLFLMAVRRRRARPVFRDLEAAEAALEECFGEDEGESYRLALRHCLDRPQGKGRQAIQLFYEGGESREEVALAMQMTADGVKTLLRRTRAWLRSCVERSLGT